MGAEAFKNPLFEEKVKVSVGEKSDGFLVDVFLFQGEPVQNRG